MEKICAQFSGDYHTLIDILEYRYRCDHDSLAFTFLGYELDGEVKEEPITFGDLVVKAKAVAKKLRETCKEGDRVLLVYDPGLEYIIAFFACLYAGVFAVPVYPPQNARRFNKLLPIIEDAGAAFALTNEKIIKRLELRLEDSGLDKVLSWISTDNCCEYSVEDFEIPRITPDSIAFIQYTSGSTGDPKGVILSHKNLVENNRLMSQAMRSERDIVTCGWMPPYHDMGLIGNILQPVYAGMHMILMSHIDFVMKPRRILEAISKYKASICAGPNFFYEMLIKRVADDLQGLDLSSWRVAITGAEPIRGHTLQSFYRAFSPAGFRYEAFLTCYGLAEGTLMVSSNGEGDAPKIVDFNQQRLKENKVEAAEPNGNVATVTSLVSCGAPLQGQLIKIVDASGQDICEDMVIGEVYLSGDCATRGYWGKEPFAEVPTGDFGFLMDGELFIVGRKKEMIILRGKNYYPTDIEPIVSASNLDLFESGATACFSVDDGSSEKLIIVQEIKRQSRKTFNLHEAKSVIQAALSKELQLRAHEIIFLNQGSLEKTSSGKIRRNVYKQKYISEKLA